LGEIVRFEVDVGVYEKYAKLLQQF